MKITGWNICLRSLEKRDMELKVKWYNDPQVNKTLILNEKLELAKSLEWFDRAKNDDSRCDFIIETKDGEPIGLTGLLGIDRMHGTAECFCVIGEKSFWGKGIGTRVHSLLLQWAFNEQNLHKIWAVVYTNNTAVLKLVKKLGFEIEGTLREEKHIGGKRIDLLRIGVLRNEFRPLAE
ncbi:MAG: GNAT family N-acetyltransferase [Planctomycetota bacterium]|jgi:RimJ/RimL family protein N-acetyltransferase